MIDYEALPGAGFSSERLDRASDDLLDVFRAIQGSARWNDVGDEVAATEAGTDYGDHVRILAKAAEWWARAYAQWVAWKSGSVGMKEEVDRGLADSRPGVYLKFWAR